MYQDDIMAMMGGPKTLEEQRMADALRSQRTGGDLLGLSTIGQVSQLGQNMSQRATAGAKQAGTLAQARAKMEAQKAEFDRTSTATEARDRATEEYRVKDLEIRGLTQAANEARKVAQSINDTNKTRIQGLKVDNQAENWFEKRGIDRFNAVEKWSNKAEEFGLKERQFGETQAQFDQRTKERRANLDFQLRKHDDTLQFKYDKQDDWNQATENRLNYHYDALEGKIANDDERWAVAREQLALDDNYNTAKLQFDKVKHEDRVDNWLSTIDIKRVGLENTDERFKREFMKDVYFLSRKYDLDEEEAFMGYIKDKDNSDWRWAKLWVDLDGDMGGKGEIPKLGSKGDVKFKEAGQEMRELFRLEETLKDDYANTSFPGEGTLAGVIYKVGQLGFGTSQANDEQGLWWSALDRLWTLPKRHELFGSAFTAQEKEAWNAAAPHKNMTPKQLREAMQSLTNIARGRMETIIADAATRGLDIDYVKDHFGFSNETETGLADPLFNNKWRGTEAAKKAGGGASKPKYTMEQLLELKKRALERERVK